WIMGRMRVPVELPDPGSFTWKDMLGGFVIGVSAITGVALLFRAYFHVGLFLLAGGWGAHRFYRVSYRLLAGKAAAAINTRVTGNEAIVEPQTSPDSIPMNAAPAVSGRRIPIALELVTAKALPPVSEESRHRL